MNRWRFSFPSILLFCLCCWLAISCSQSVPNPSPDGNMGDRISLGTTTSISTLDPADAYGGFEGTLLYNLGDRLYTYKLGSSELQPQLATALPTISADGLTYKIPLRSGVVFHDGTPFNAEAMAFSLRRFIENGGKPASVLATIVEDKPNAIQATGEYELTIKLQKPFAAFPATLAFSGACAVSPKAYEIKKGSFQPSRFVGTGPYRLVRYGTDSLKLDAFDRYWGQKPVNRGIDLQVFSSPANLFNAFRTGAVDVAYQGLAIEQTRNLQETALDRGWQVIERSGSGINVLTLNLKSPPLDRLEVRQAIALMISRPLLTQRVFRGQVESLYSLIPSTLREQQQVFQQAYGDFSALTAANQNLDRAKALLTQAGYSETKPLKVEFWYRSNLPNDQLAALTLAGIVRKTMGNWMTLELKSVESTTASANLDKGVYPMILFDWIPDFLDADNYIQPFMECSKGSQKTGCEDGSSYLWGSFYFNQQVNQLIDQSRRETNPDRRKQIFQTLQEILVKDVPFIPLWQNKDYLFAQKRMTGVTLEVTQKVPFWTIAKS